MSATEPNVMRTISAAGLASERVPQRTNNPSLGKVATRLGADFKSLTQALMRKVSAAIQLPTFPREVPIVLTIVGQKLQFPSSAEFEFAIASRAEPPTERVTELEKLTLFELRTMATDIRKLEKRLSDVLAASLEGRTSVCDLLGQLEIKLFSADHNWRAIFKALGTLEGRKYDGYRRVALVHAMLGERQSVIQRIYASRGSELQAVPRRASTGTRETTAVRDFHFRPHAGRNGRRRRRRPFRSHAGIDRGDSVRNARGGPHARAIPFQACPG